MCLFPLLQTHLKMKKEEVKHIEGMQWYRLSQVAFIDLKTLLYEQAYPWKTLKKEVVGQLPDQAITLIGKGCQKTYSRNYRIRCIEKFSKKTTQHDYLLLEIEIFFSKGSEKSPSFYHTVLMENVPTKV